MNTTIIYDYFDQKLKGMGLTPKDRKAILNMYKSNDKYNAIVLTRKVNEHHLAVSTAFWSDVKKCARTFYTTVDKNDQMALLFVEDMDNKYFL